METKLFLSCSSELDLEIHVYLGFSSYGTLKAKTDCLSGLRSVIVKEHTFLLSTKILLLKNFILEKKTRLTSKVQLTFSSMSQSPNEKRQTEIKKQKSYIETLNLSTESYKVHKLHASDSNFLTISIKQISNIRHMINLCGIVGMYILEEVHDKALTYGPYCNMSKFDALSGDTFEFYSHTNYVTIVVYNFNPLLEPTFSMKVYVYQSKCQGVPNICFFFSKLTPERYFQIPVCFG